MRVLFQKISHSIYSPIFYSQITQTSWKGAFGYFFLLILLLTALQSLFFLKPIILDLPAQIDRSLIDAVANYPSELEIKIKNGEAQTNVKEPY